MNLEELRLRQIANQYLLTPADKRTVVRDLCGVQAQFMVNAMHSLKIRCTDYDEATLSDGLVKNWTIRGTVHVFAEEDLPLFMHCDGGKTYRLNDWHHESFWNQWEGWVLTPERQAELSEIILNSLSGQPRSREALKEICRAGGMTEAEEKCMFDPWGGGVRELCERGFMNHVVQEKKQFCLSPEFTPIPVEQAQLEMARRYFTHMGPATIHDAMYYFHATAAQIKGWLSQLPVSSTECAGKTYYFIENGKPCDQGMPACLFLAGFDQLLLSHEKKESLFLRAQNLRSVFNLAGIVMPALLLHGQVAGRWKKKGRKLSIELFEGLCAPDKAAIREKAESLWSDLSSIEFSQ